MLDKITSTSQSRPYTIITIVVIISFFTGLGLTRLDMSVETEAFLPEDYISVKVNRVIQEYIGETKEEIILIEGEDLLNREVFLKVNDFKESIREEFDGEGYVLHLHSYQDFIIPVLEDIIGGEDGKTALRREVDDAPAEMVDWRDIPAPIFDGIIDSLLEDEEFNEIISRLLKDRNSGLILLMINPELEHDELLRNTKELRSMAARVSEAEPFDLSVTGWLSMELDTNELMQRDNQFLIPLSAIVVIVILFLIFRRLTDTVLPFLILGVGALWMVGTMGLVGIPFTMVYVALVPVMLGIGIDYNIHMLNRYYEERRRGTPAPDSTVRSVRTVGIAIALTAITTAIGFGSFGISEIPPIGDFGLVAGIGILYIFLLTTFLLPSLISIRDRGKEESFEERGQHDRIGVLLDKFGGFALSRKTPILAIAGVLTILCVFASFGLTTAMDFGQFLPEDVESIRTMNRIEDKFGGQQSIIVVADGPGVTTPSGMQEMLEMEEIVMSDPRGENLIIRSRSPASYLLINLGIEQIPEDPMELYGIIEMARARRGEEFRRYLPHDNMAIFYFTINAETSDELRNVTEIIRNGVREFSRRGGEYLNVMIDGEPKVGGGPAMLSDIMNSILPDMRNSIIVAVLLVSISLAIIFKSPLLGLIGVVPVTIALFWEFGTLYVLGWPLDVMNMTVSALAIGIGVDFSIHMTHRFREEFKENHKSPEEAMSISIKSVGKAILAAASTTMGVFIILSFSKMPPIARFGQLAALIIFFCLIASLIILPPLLLAYFKWRER